MKRMIGGFAVIVFLTVVLISWFSSACAPSSLAMTVATPTQTTAPTATTDPTPTPTMDVQDIKEAEFNQDIQNFIKKTGEYSDEAMNEKLMSYYSEKLALGWIMESGTGIVDFQGDFLGYIKSGDYIIMAIGFNGADGKNLVKPMAIPIRFFSNPNNQSNVFPLQFVENREWDMKTHHSIEYESSLEGVIGRLDKVKNSPVILSIWDGLIDSNIDDAKEYFGNGSIVYFDELNESGGLVNGLISDVVVSSNEDVLGRKTKYPLGSSVPIPNIESIDDLKNVDISTVPKVSMISSNLW